MYIVQQDFLIKDLGISGIGHSLNATQRSFLFVEFLKS